MNKIYRLIWSQVLNTWVCCAENARGRGKSGSSRKLIVGSMAFAGSALLATAALAAPTGGQISAGSGTISQAGLITTINQSSQNLAVNWQSFNIAANETVNFLQPSTTAIAVNRIFSTNGSQILGNLNANGQIYLINPNGIIFGAGAQVNVGGLVASTLDMTNSADGKVSFAGSGTGSIVNQGRITAANGGYVAFIGNTVNNTGTITAPMGAVGLGAGNAVTLTFAGNSLVQMQVDQSVLNSLANNGGLIQANGGMVILTAGARDALLASVVNNTGVIEAQTVQNQSGKIILLGGMAAGTVNVSGTLDASAPSPSASLLPLPQAGEGLGRGGVIETSAAHVHVADSAKVTTLAGNGLNGTWLIDPVDFTIAASGGDMTGAAVNAALAGGNFSIVSTNGAAGTAGNVNVNDTVSWSANQLTLNAQNNININSAMNASGTASLALFYGQGAVAAGNTSNIVTGVNGVVNLPAGTTNFTTKQGSDGVTKNYTVITSLGVAADATGGAATLQGMATTANLATNYVLGANIDATTTSGWNAGAGFTPIGTDPSRFTGIFDGLGHTVSGLFINRAGSNNTGLFGYTAAGSMVRNVGLIGGSVASDSWGTGSLVGQLGGTLINSYATGSVYGFQTVGGLVGVIDGGAIVDSHATGAVVAGPNGEAGGLVGLIWGSPRGTVTNSYATGNVSSAVGHVGGLVGINWGTVTRSYATGTASGTDYIGGLIGDNSLGSIISSYATGAVSGNNQVGGLAGNNSNSITNSYATGSVSGISNVGGLVGLNSGTISNSFYDLDVVTVNGAKPFAAYGLYTAQFTDWKNSGFSLNPVTYFGVATAINTYTVNTVQNLKDLLGFTGSAALTFTLAGNIDMGTAPTGFYIPTWAGTFDGTGKTISNFTLSNSNGNIGFFGTTQSGSTIKNLGLLNVNVSGSAGSNIGGLVGYGSGTISNSYATGSVSGGSNVGGLVGHNLGNISNSYATGSVTGAGNVGGLVGYNNYGTISNSYTTGSVTGSSYVGGLVGYLYGGSGTISNSFWDTQTSGQATSAGGLGMTTAQMQTQASFTPAGTGAGQWDFTPGTGTWTIFEGQSNPLLRSFLTPLTVTANNASKTYDGQAYNGSAGVTYSVTPNMSNLLGTLNYTGNSQGATNAGSYTITPGGLTTAPVQQGYIISYVNGTLTVNAAPLTTTTTGTTAGSTTVSAVSTALESSFGGQSMGGQSASGNSSGSLSAMPGVSSTITLLTDKPAEDANGTNPAGNSSPLGAASMLNTTLAFGTTGSLQIVNGGVNAPDSGMNVFLNRRDGN